MSSPSITRHLRIRGLVQGVGFRWSLCAEAQALGLDGWVRNRSDGSVEALVSGPATAVAILVDWARRGPPSARVSAFEEGDSAPAGTPPCSSGFVQLPTT